MTVQQLDDPALPIVPFRRGGKAFRRGADEPAGGGGVIARRTGRPGPKENPHAASIFRGKLQSPGFDVGQPIEMGNRRAHAFAPETFRQRGNLLRGISRAQQDHPPKIDSSGRNGRWMQLSPGIAPNNRPAPRRLCGASQDQRQRSRRRNH
jgi:hypothetical protein